VFSIVVLAFCVPAWSQSTVAQMRIQQEVLFSYRPPRGHEETRKQYPASLQEEGYE